MRFILIFILFFFASFIPQTNAQSSMIYGGQALTIELSPSFPGPEESFTATLNDYALSVSSIGIRWYIDGKLQENTLNERKISTSTKTFGQKTTVEAVITLTGGGTLSVSRVIDPVYLDIIIEPQTRVPAFYKGRPLPSIDSLVNATALINGNAILPTNLIYSWRLNDQVLGGGMMRGKNTVTFAMPRGRSATLSLDVQNQSGETIARKLFELPSVRPELSFYATSPLFGLTTKVIHDAIPLIGNSFSVRAEPYYLDLRTFLDPDVLEWKLNGYPTAGENNNPYEITLAKNENVVVGGKTPINFHVRNTSQVLQGAEGDFVLSY